MGETAGDFRGVAARVIDAGKGKVSVLTRGPGASEREREGISGRWASDGLLRLARARKEKGREMG